MNWITYGPANILWISDVSLLLAYFATIFESRFLASMAALQGFIFESLWVIIFLASRIFPWNTELTGYMSNVSIPLWIRCLSLFHMILPIYFAWLLVRFGYTRKALPIQIGICWFVILLTWAVTNPKTDINFVFSYLKFGMDPTLYLSLLLIGLTLVILLTHFLILKTKLIKKANS
ncbi:MAG TPA: hypothetical protein VLE96_05395 [Chlamydiales bacterium]|nr:hypothetical protein [Chlamydiales bacterium]